MGLCPTEVIWKKELDWIFEGIAWKMSEYLYVCVGGIYGVDEWLPVRVKD